MSANGVCPYVHTNLCVQCKSICNLHLITFTMGGCCNWRRAIETELGTQSGKCDGICSFYEVEGTICMKGEKSFPITKHIRALRWLSFLRILHSSNGQSEWHARIWQISIRIRSPSATTSDSSFTSSNNLRKAATNNIAVRTRIRRKTHHVVADAPGLEDAPGAVHVGAHLRAEAHLVEQRVDQVAPAALALAHRPAPHAGGLAHCLGALKM